MLSLRYLFETPEFWVPTPPDEATKAATRIWKAKMAEFHDKQTWGRKLFDKLNPVNNEQEKAFEAAKDAAAKRLKK